MYQYNVEVQLFRSVKVAPNCIPSEASKHDLCYISLPSIQSFLSIQLADSYSPMYRIFELLFVHANRLFQIKYGANGPTLQSLWGCRRTSSNSSSLVVLILPWRYWSKLIRYDDRAVESLDIRSNRWIDVQKPCPAIPFFRVPILHHTLVAVARGGRLPRHFPHQDLGLDLFADWQTKKFWIQPMQGKTLDRLTPVVRDAMADRLTLGRVVLLKIIMEIWNFC